MMIKHIYNLITETNLNNYKLVTSNINKLKEFQRFGIRKLSIEAGRDLKEVLSSDIDVIIYKALEAGTHRICEDTSLSVEGESIGVNIRWLLSEIPKLAGKKADWKVLLGLNDGSNIKIFEGVISGTLISPKIIHSDSFGFDPFFIPNGINKSLYELEKEGKKDNFSARRIAVNNLLKDNPIKTILIKNIKPWKGDYQH